MNVYILSKETIKEISLVRPRVSFVDIGNLVLFIAYVPSFYVHKECNLNYERGSEVNGLYQIRWNFFS